MRNEPMNLRYCMYSAFDAGEKRHAQQVMASLGITYQKATPQSLSDQWWFWNCENVPDPLPPYLTELGLKPHDAIGHGLSKEDADALVTGETR
jgi:hypothetical protein